MGKQFTPPGQINWTVSYNVESDSLFNGILYKQIYESWNGPLNPYYLIREDTMVGKVWMVFLRFSPATEYLMMDYSLQVGDTFRLNFPLYGLDTVAAVSVDAYNRRHIKFKMNHPVYGSKEIVEGVGFTYGLWSTIYPSGDQYKENAMLCQWKDGIKTYANTNYNGECFYEHIMSIPSTNEQIGNDQLIVYPNPATHKIYLSNTSSSILKNYQYKIYNTFGQIIKQGKADGNAIDIDELTDGVYLLTTFSNNHLQTIHFTKINN